MMRHVYNANTTFNNYKSIMIMYYTKKLAFMQQLCMITACVTLIGTGCSREKENKHNQDLEPKVTKADIDRAIGSMEIERTKLKNLISQLGSHEEKEIFSGLALHLRRDSQKIHELKGARKVDLQKRLRSILSKLSKIKSGELASIFQPKISAAIQKAIKDQDPSEDLIQCIVELYLEILAGILRELESYL